MTANPEPGTGTDTLLPPERWVERLYDGTSTPAADVIDVVTPATSAFIVKAGVADHEQVSRAAAAAASAQPDWAATPTKSARASCAA